VFLCVLHEQLKTNKVTIIYSYTRRTKISILIEVSGFTLLQQFHHEITRFHNAQYLLELLAKRCFNRIYMKRPQRATFHVTVVLCQYNLSIRCKVLLAGCY
jgi:hypothetical protein